MTTQVSVIFGVLESYAMCVYMDIVWHNNIISSMVCQTEEGFNT